MQARVFSLCLRETGSEGGDPNKKESHPWPRSTSKRVSSIGRRVPPPVPATAVSRNSSLTASSRNFRSSKSMRPSPKWRTNCAAWVHRVMDSLVQIIVWLNALASLLGGFLLTPIGLVPGWLSVTLVAVVTGILLLIAFKYTSNQRALKAVRDDIKRTCWL